MLDRAKKTETVGVNCSATNITLPDDMLSSTRITYDAATNNWDTYLPVKGDVVKTEEIDSWTNTTPNWVTTNRNVYDVNGRVTETYDALNRKTTKSYTPAIAGPLTSTTDTNPLGHSTTMTLAPAWQLPVTTVDNANGRQTDVIYDGLGRLLKVWLPGRAKTTYPTGPNLEFGYLVRNNAPSAVTSKSILPAGTYKTSITLYDGLLRERQTQTQAPGGGRLLTDTVYDSRGLVVWTSNPYHDVSNAAPDTTLVQTEDKRDILSYTENVYDGAGRVTDAILKVRNNVERWRTTTWTGGDFPVGGARDAGGPANGVLCRTQN